MFELKSKIKAVIFDMDGTIIKTEHIWNDISKEVLSSYGITTFTPEQLQVLDTLQGGGLSFAAQVLKEHFKLPYSPDEIIRKNLEVARVRLDRDKIDFVDGFELFHQKIQNLFIPTGMATNADLESLQSLTQRLRFERFFGENMYCVSHVGKPKPDPALFLHTAEKLNAKPEECIVFEDSLVGFKAAQSAGMKCIAIKNSGNQNVLDYVHDAIDNYHQAEDVLKKLV
jgi:beta-phosphoglucomutase-like phosphatase (HAD superfamily)